MPRNIFFRQIKQMRWQRTLCTSPILNSEEFIIKSTLPNIVIPKLNFLERVSLDWPGFKNHVAVECAETKRSYTYQQLQNNMGVFATSLHKKLGLKQGDVVAVMLPNSPEFLVVALGTLQAGCVLTTINPIYKEYEVTHQVTTTDPKVIVTTSECYSTVITSLRNAKNSAKVIIVDKPGVAVPNGAVRFSEIETGAVDAALLDKIQMNDEDVAIIPFSSGTTGLPKGVEITYKNLRGALQIMTEKEISLAEPTTADFQDVVPCILPFFHIYGLIITVIGHLVKGCKLVTMSKFSASLYFDVLKNQKASLLYIVPPIAILLGKHPDVSKDHLHTLRHIVCGAAPLTAADADAILEKSDNKISFRHGFGATETTSIGTTNFGIGDLSSCGVPMPSMEIKFVDPISERPVAIGEPGELYVRGPTIMKGYHRNPKATKESLTEDGFFKTGDLGYYKQDGGLYITDRIKELIKVKGMQVAPAELEGILRSHPAVQEAAVIGVPHEYFGEVPKAFIIPKKDKKLTSDEVIDFVAAKVAAFKKIEEVMFVEDIPKTSSGKILRRDLKKMYA